MFDTHPYLKLVGLTAAVIFGTMFNWNMVSFGETAFFNWLLGVLTGALWAFWFVLFTDFLERGDDDVVRRDEERQEVAR